MSLGSEAGGVRMRVGEEGCTRSVATWRRYSGSSSWWKPVSVELYLGVGSVRVQRLEGSG